MIRDAVNAVGGVTVDVQSIHGELGPAWTGCVGAKELNYRNAANDVQRVTIIN